MEGHVDEHRTTGAAADQSKVYRDLRRRSQRRAHLARMLETKRRERTERAMRTVRQRRFNQGG
jgi:hypothetical protein